jgi:hypothetical protein
LEASQFLRNWFLASVSKNWFLKKIVWLFGTQFLAFFIESDYHTHPLPLTGLHGHGPRGGGEGTVAVGARIIGRLRRRGLYVRGRRKVVREAGRVSAGWSLV